ncbi:MAG TPA: hypothetical protein PK870_06680 [Clostridia bacterium]|nr:hypothetical protein [Clostridia bacterium]
MRKDPSVTKIAYSVHKTSLLFRALVISLIAIVILLSAAYLVSAFYDRYSSFTVSTSYSGSGSSGKGGSDSNSSSLLKLALSLSETPDFLSPTSRLDADAIENCTNISGYSIPENVDSINGQHNGANYIAYTFYLKNAGSEAVTYEYVINLLNVTQNVDEAVRIRLYVDGNPNTYAKTKKDGTGPEKDTIEFLTESIAVRSRRAYFKPGDITKFTVVIWIEGDDPECTDDIIGGKFKVTMDLTIVERS